MRVAVIPARCGSKRILRKNINFFAGKPMIAYAIDLAQSCGLFDHVLVSTDDTEIAEISVKYGAEVPFMRPASLADDFTGTIPVVAHAIRSCQELGWQFDQVCCVYPAVPFLQKTDLVSTLEMLEADETGFTFPITAYPSAIQRALRRFPDGHVEPFHSQFSAVRTQDLEPAFHDAGQFYWGLAQTWLEAKNIHMHGAGLVIPNWRVVDVDTHDDWQRAEYLLQVLRDAGEI